MEPETLGDAGTGTFPKLGVSDVGRLSELAAATLWGGGGDLGLTPWASRGLESRRMCAQGLGLAELYPRQARPVVLLG